MSQGLHDRNGMQDRPTEERVAIHFRDFPFEVTSKYVIRHRLDEMYPPSTLLHDPRADGLTDAQAVSDPIVEMEEQNDQSASVRTRSTAQGRKEVQEELHMYDKNEAHERLANLATEHFISTPAPKESDAIVGFLYRCRTADSELKVV
ncbi:hypothetical protein MPSI1_003106 [Malassezia psittaci]|uniref:Histone deacetylase complex subunit SAP30 Sin3 binding domain-containing protein n=1 Tax=Malassezia psittaci TaxID=1821823 RepID=A0AAF0FH29_9BASI|nr:hypothetical protein MPSI1_003106 [Malassezia psittaci]